MRLYLSSFRLGDHPERFVSMVPPPGRVAVICNAIDNEPEERPEKVAQEIAWLSELGLEPSELDLRDYFGAGEQLVPVLSAYQAVGSTGASNRRSRPCASAGGCDHSAPLGQAARFTEDRKACHRRQKGLQRQAARLDSHQ
jgi:dipeptidase E